MATSKLRKSKGWNRAVSRKFYISIAERVRSVASLSKCIREQYMMRVIDDYIANGTVPASFSDMENVVLALLQPLIDKAMLRSRHAREIADRRKQQRHCTVDSNAVSEKETVMSGNMVEDEVAIPKEKSVLSAPTLSIPYTTKSSIYSRNARPCRV